jgi:ABC-type glucose/galactose transport system permease subunit
MGSNRIVEAGGITLCLAGVVTAAYLTQDTNFGFIFPILHVMNMAIGMTIAGLVALMKPRLAPISGIIAAGIALEVFVSQFNDPLWAIPAIVGALLCIGGPISQRFTTPGPTRQ